MRTHDRRVDAPGLTPSECARHIDMLTQRIVSCCCTCPHDILEISEWKSRLTALLPQQREGD